MTLAMAIPERQLPFDEPLQCAVCKLDKLFNFTFAFSLCRGDYYIGLHANDLQKTRLATNMPYPYCAYHGRRHLLLFAFEHSKQMDFFS